MSFKRGSLVLFSYLLRARFTAERLLRLRNAMRRRSPDALPSRRHFFAYSRCLQL